MRREEEGQGDQGRAISNKQKHCDQVTYGHLLADSAEISRERERGYQILLPGPWPASNSDDYVIDQECMSSWSLQCTCGDDDDIVIAAHSNDDVIVHSWYMVELN